MTKNLSIERPIGIFDSGVGGLTVVKEILRQLPEEDIIYFGDTARVPYGTKSERTVVKFSLQNSRFLSQFKIKFLIVACNTASALSLDVLRQEFSFPVMGVIEPGARTALRLSSSKRIGIIGTETTITSRAYPKIIEQIDTSARIFSRACPLFVPLVEEGWLDGDITKAVAGEYLRPLKNEKIDSLILGCTHYPLLKSLLQAEMEGVTLVDSAEEVVKQAKKVLEEKKLLRLSKGHSPSRYYYVSDVSTRFVMIGRNFLGEDIMQVKQVDIERY